MQQNIYNMYENSKIYLGDLAEKNESLLKALINKDKFKLYLSDVGLLRALSNLDYSEILLDKNEMFKGCM